MPCHTIPFCRASFDGFVIDVDTFFLFVFAGENLNLPTIYLITPTYKRPEQIPDLTRLAQTLMHVPSIMWLVIEDAESLSPQVSDILRRSGIRFTHMLGKPSFQS
jgi:hypothetical protein